MRSSSPLRPLVMLILLLVASLTLPVAAHGQDTATESGTGRVAAALERSPVLVQPPFDRVISAADRRDLVRRIETSGKPVLMAFVPLVDGDQFNGEARAFVAALHDRLGDDAIYVAVDNNRYLRTFEYRGGQSRYGKPVSDATTLANYGGDRAAGSDRTLLERAQLLLDYLALPPAELEQRVAAFDAEREQRARTSPNRSDDAEGSSAVVLILVGALIASIGGALWRRQRRRSGARPAAEALPVLPDRLFEHARAAHHANLRSDADDELLKLSKLLDDQPMPTKPAAQDAYQRALDAYASARRRTGDQAPTVDLVGALVLVDHARNDLAGAVALDAGQKPPKRPALCMFDPLHGRAARNVGWEHDGRKLDVPACKACATAVTSGAVPDALRDGDQPYFEGDTVWAATGFGTLGDDLVERVSRGER